MAEPNRTSKRNVQAKMRSIKRKNNRKLSKRKSLDITVNLPFPPQIKLEKFFPSKYNVSLRTLNAFIIYRKVVTAEIKKNHTLCWSKISEIASSKWSLEDAKVKQHYKELAEKVKALYRSKHLFYVHHGKNAVGSIMLQDDNEAIEKPKTFIFVSEYENNSLNDSGNEATAFSEQIENNIEMSMSNNSDNTSSHILLNESEQNFTSDNIAFSPEHTHMTHNFIEFFNNCDIPMTALLHYNGDEMIHSIVNEFS